MEKLLTIRRIRFIMERNARKENGSNVPTVHKNMWAYIILSDNTQLSYDCSHHPEWRLAEEEDIVHYTDSGQKLRYYSGKDGYTPLFMYEDSSTFEKLERKCRVLKDCSPLALKELTEPQTRMKVTRLEFDFECHQTGNRNEKHLYAFALLDDAHPVRTDTHGHPDWATLKLEDVVVKDRETRHCTPLFGYTNIWNLSFDEKEEE